MTFALRVYVLYVCAELINYLKFASTCRMSERCGANLERLEKCVNAEKLNPIHMVFIFNLGSDIRKCKRKLNSTKLDLLLT